VTRKRCGGKAQVSMHAGQCCSCIQSVVLESKKTCETVSPAMWYQKNINTHHHVMGFDVVSLWNQSGTDPHCCNKQQRHEICQDFLQFAHQYCATLDCLWFSDEAHFCISGFANRRTQSSGPPNICTKSWRHHSILQSAPCGVQSTGKVLLDQSLLRAS